MENSKTKKPHSVRLDEATDKRLREMEDRIKDENNYTNMNEVYNKIMDDMTVYAQSSSVPTRVRPYLKAIGSSLDSVQANVASLAKMIEEADDRAKVKYEAVIQRKEEHCDDLMRLIHANQEELKDAEEEISKLKSENAKLRSEIARLKKDIEGKNVIDEAAFLLESIMKRYHNENEAVRAGNGGAVPEGSDSKPEDPGDNDSKESE